MRGERRGDVAAKPAAGFAFVGDGFLDSVVRGWFPEGTRLHEPQPASRSVGAAAESGGADATLDFAPRADRLGLGATLAPLAGSLEGAAASSTGAGKRLAQRMIKTQKERRQGDVDSGRTAGDGNGGDGPAGGNGSESDEDESRSQSIARSKKRLAARGRSRSPKKGKRAKQAAAPLPTPAADADWSTMTKNQRKKRRKREAAALRVEEQKARQQQQLAAQGAVKIAE